MFDDILNEGDRRQIIDGPINTEDIFIDDDYLFDDDDAQETKNLCDYVLDNVEQNNILFKHKPEDDTPNYLSPPEPLPTFSDILLPKDKSREKQTKKKKKVPKTEKLGKRQNREMVKKTGKRALQELKEAKYIQTNGVKTATMTMVLTLMT